MLFVVPEVAPQTRDQRHQVAAPDRLARLLDHVHPAGELLGPALLLLSLHAVAPPLLLLPLLLLPPASAVAQQ